MATPPKARFELRHPEANPIPEVEPKTNFQKVREFHEKFGTKRAAIPMQDVDLMNLRLELIDEELLETREAVWDDDLVGVADGLCDLLYVIYGFGDVLGLDIARLFAEVHASNMSKLGEDGKPILREDGKILKGPNFFHPDLETIINDTKVMNNEA